MTLDELTSVAWQRFEAAGGLDQASMSVAVLAVLRAVLEAGPKDRPERGYQWPEANASDDAWNQCCEVWRERIEEMMK